MTKRERTMTVDFLLLANALVDAFRSYHNQYGTEEWRLDEIERHSGPLADRMIHYLKRTAGE